MNSIATQSILGQPLAVVQKPLGPIIHHQSNPEKQTDYYVHGVNFLRDIFPVSLSGVIGVYRKERCIALRIILNKRDPRYASFVYNREIASRLFEKVVSNDYAYWHQIEAGPRANNTFHYVYCMGGNVATTWDAAAIDGPLKSDVIIYLDTRCGETDHSVVAQPFVSPSGTAANGNSGSTAAPIAIGLSRTDASPPSEAKTFPDIAGNTYEAEILKAANRYHFLNGYEDGTFKPDNPVTREPAINLLIGVVDSMVVDEGAIAMPDELQTAPFVDVPADHRSARQFYYAKQVGILSGDDQNKAHPDASLTRAELIVLVYQGLQVVVSENFNTVVELSEVIEPTSPDADFDDIADHWSEPIVRELATYGIATPLDESGTKFGPDTAAKRDYTAAVLVRMLEVEFNQLPGLETRPAPVKVFPDIGTDPYKEEIIKAANQYGIVAGYEDNKFHPTDYLSREQAVTILINAMQNRLPPEAIQIPETLSDPPPFPDVTTGANATKIQFAKDAKLVSGDEMGLFRPLDRLSRAQLMSMIHSAMSYVVDSQIGPDVPLKEVLVEVEEHDSAYTDVSTDHWAYALIDDLLPTGIVSAYNEQGKEFRPEQSAERNYAAAAMVRMIETQFSRESQTRPDQVQSVFTDIEGNPYQLEIELAATGYQLVKGYEDGTFRPTSPISREQAVAILIDALEQRVVNKNAVIIPDALTQPPFADVPTDRWSAPRLYFAKQAGIIAGDEAERFFPEAQLGRAQLMAIAYQALAYATWADFGEPKPLDQIFETGMHDTYNFEDIPDNHWAAGIMPIISVLGLAQPLELSAPNQFVPDGLGYRDYTVATAVHMIQLMYTELPTLTDEVRFMDIAGDPYAEEIIQAANQYRIVSGAEDGNFHPLESIHREHVVAMLVNALKSLVKDPDVIQIPARLTQDPFRDVPADSLFAPQIQFVAEAGIMSGDEDTDLFRPKNDLTRAELMAVTHNALKFAVNQNYGEETDLESVINPNQENSPPFSDIAGHWGEGAIALMARLGVALPRERGSSEFLPDEPSRRNFAAASMVHMLEVPFKAQTSS